MATETAGQSAHFWDYWQIIRSRKEIVLAVFLFVVITGVAVTLYMPRVYMASTRILVSRETPAVEGVEKRTFNLGYDPYFLRTQFEIIQSRAIIYDVIRNLGLMEHFGRLYNEDGQPMSLGDAYRIVAGGMKVHQYRDTNLIEIQMYRSTRGIPPDVARGDAARIANEIANVYRDQRMKISRMERERGVAALRDAYDRQRTKVQELEERLEDLRRELNIVAVGRELSGAMLLDKSRLTQLEADRLAAQNRMIERKTKLEVLEKLGGEELLSAGSYILNDPLLTVLRQHVIESEARLTELLEGYGPNHPDVLRSQAVVNSLKTKLDETVSGLKIGLQSDYEIAQRELEAVESELEQARESDISAQAEKYLPFRKIEHEVDSQREIRDTLELRVVSEQIDLELPRMPVEVVDAAEAPDPNDPVSPKLVLNVILSVILGIGMGIGLAFFMEYLDTSVKTVEDIEEYIGAPILGVIPQKVKPLLHEGPDSAHAEAYRVLRTNIQFSKKWGQAKTVCITSGGAGEGKSLTLFNLAYVFAQLGSRVVIVDSDLRRPTQHKMLNVSNRVGLVDVLLGRATTDEVVQATPVQNLFFMPSGKLPSGAHGVLDAERMRRVLGELREKYDYVFFDAPPILGVSDASVIASEVDCVLLIIEHRSYPRVVSSRAKSMIDNVGANLIGVVLNNINVHRDYYYYYHSSYYYSPYHQSPSGSKKGAKAVDTGGGA